MDGQMTTLTNLLGEADSLIWRPLERLNRTRKVAQYRSKRSARAMEVLRNIESYKGKTSPKIIKSCDDYAIDVLGGKGHAPSLYVYSAYAGEFKDGWIPGTYYDLVVVPEKSGGFGSLSYLKSLAGLLFNSNHFPDIARVMQGVFYDQEFHIIEIQDLRDRLFCSSSRIVFKLDRSGNGRSVYVYNQDDFDPQQVLRLGDGVFQYFIEQHEALRMLSPSAAATLRMTTAVDKNGDASVRACYLRVGRKADLVIKSLTAMRIVVDPRDGSIAPRAFLPYFRQIAAHPDTDVAFDGGSFPYYSKCVEAVTDLHRRVPFVACIGWDVCIDSSNEPKIFEWNGQNNAISFGEAVQGPCFRGLGWEHLWKNEGKHTTSPERPKH
jgi:hypothetical protein